MEYIYVNQEGNRVIFRIEDSASEYKITAIEKNGKEIAVAEIVKQKGY